MGLTKAQLIDEIEKRIFTFEGWTIGISENPTQRREEHGNPPGWCHWEADSENTAREVEKHFLDMGCKGWIGGVGNPNCVCLHSLNHVNTLPMREHGNGRLFY